MENYSNGGFNNEGLWIFAILALFGGDFGGFGGNKSTLSEADLCNANSFSELKASVSGLSSQINGLSSGICDFGYNVLSQFNAIERELSECCCTTQRSIDSVRFDMANYAASMNANTTAGIQKILDAMAREKIDTQNQRIWQLELQQAMCGIVRYPTQMSYFTNCNPFGQNGHFGACGC